MTTKLKKKLSGWGGYPVAESYVQRPEKIRQLSVSSHATIPRGCGRAYNDAAINGDGDVVMMERLNRFLSFDAETGMLLVEAGVTVGEILEHFVPRGWFLPVVPGTKRVTVGGCVAADVHGKNHHAFGTFSSSVREIELMLADESVKKVSPAEDPALFWATVGGMGLTGIITTVLLQLMPIQSAYMQVRHTATKSLNETLELLSGTFRDVPYSVAWLDCFAMGKGVVMTGDHLEDGKKKIPRLQKERALPLPSVLLNSATARLFNRLYYWVQSQKNKPFVIDYDRYFFPLDSVANWNRFYGDCGFVQYQCVISEEKAQEGFTAILKLLSGSGHHPYLAVLKRMGAEGEGLLSFPKEGFTLALDMPIKDGLFPLLDTLDELVLSFGGRNYLAKDGRMKSETFRAMYPRFSQWCHVKADVDPKGIFSSDMSRRLEMGGVL